MDFCLRTGLLSTHRAAGAEERSLSRVGNPHRRSPDYLSIRLLAANVVVAGLARCRRLIAPAKVDFGRLRLGRVDVCAVLDDAHFGEWPRAFKLHLERRRRRGAECVAHHMRARAYVRQNIVRRRIDVPPFESVEDRRSRTLSHEHIGVAYVGRDVIRTRLERQLVPHLERQIDESLRTPAAD